jgi:hypothetical protein
MIFGINAFRFTAWNFNELDLQESLNFSFSIQSEAFWSRIFSPFYAILFW